MADTADRIDKASQKVSKLADKFGVTLVSGFHLLALFAIGATIVWAAVFEFVKMLAQGHATVEDILLLFIFWSWAPWWGSISPVWSTHATTALAECQNGSPVLNMPRAWSLLDAAVPCPLLTADLYLGRPAGGIESCP